MQRIESAYDLKPGDVVVVDVTITDRATGQDRIWRRYACVIKTTGKHFVGVLTLKLKPEAKDYRDIHLTRGNEVVYLMPEDKWPQGVVAMRMKLIAQGKIKLSGDA